MANTWLYFGWERGFEGGGGLRLFTQPKYSHVVHMLSVKQPFCIQVFGLDQELATNGLANQEFQVPSAPFLSLTRFKGSWGQLWPKTGPKQQTIKTKMTVVPEA